MFKPYNMNYKIISQFIAVILFFLVFSVKAQSLKGTILDVAGQPVEGVYIFNKNSKSHTHSNELGSFILNETKAKDSVVVGLLGYEKQNFKLTESQMKSSLQISLKTKNIVLDELVLSQELDALNTLIAVDLETSPVRSSQELLRKVPGLFIGQHAGGGKAEQIFLRGFDVDHGTDVALSVDGLPVNMVSHAHGQGYSDLHFLIPETIQNINFGKGAYYANKGDFNTAGFVDFKTANSLETNQISFSAGQFNSTRLLGMFNLLKQKKGQNFYVALEHILTDGPFEASQNFNRTNIFGKYSALINENNSVSLTASHFTSSWDASGQSPERAVNSNQISRFGAIDSTEGGITSRTNFNLQQQLNLAPNTSVSSNIYFTQYDFKLYSNFTFFLEDPINGDQIKQKESRQLFGFNTTFKTIKKNGKTDVDFNYGLGLRYDINDNVELSRTLNRRTTLENIQLGDIRQNNTYGFFNADVDFGKFIIAPGFRLENFKFQYNDALQVNYETQSASSFAFLPKLNLFYNQNNNLQWFIKSGVGFHSNDARVVLSQDVQTSLPKSVGADFGVVAKPTSNLVLNLALWYLQLEQEFVYVGDAGIVEPSGKTERKGIDLGLRYQFSDHVYANSDLSLTHARGIEDRNNLTYIPLAPNFTLAGGLFVKDYKKWSGGLTYRWLGDRPADETNTVKSEGYFITDLNLNYSFTDSLSGGIVIENIFDTEWNETQFLTESRLQNEIESVEEIHFTPGTPFFIKAQVTYKF